ncbi:hypothetical protein WJX72_001266 [[Myrmecia] bisecta]|uniref:Brix domain-containing protein n=1 Tax=[Myrmecia] bisecta TaxID=41462 RepID=A0AAW1PS48_9CHLO
MGKVSGHKRRDRDEDEGPPPVPAGKATLGQLTSHISNKMVRSETYAKLKHKQKKQKKAERQKRQKEAAKAEQLGLEPPPKKIPKTLENTREKDETMVAGDDDEVRADEAEDEFAEHFANMRPPNVLLTTCYKPSGIMYKFLADMLEVFPCAQYYKRQGFPLKKIVNYATNRGFTDVVVFNEDRKQLNGMLVIHLPGGPTAHFKMSNVVLCKDIKGHGRPTSHKPELILNNFDTRLGHRVGRMFASLFSQDPAFRGRRAVTFHNQRDFIFFRHHRYIFEEKQKREPGEKEKRAAVIARLQELGPRFTLKLLSLQHGTFDTKGGEYEWVHKTTMDTSRRRFFL